MRPLRHISFLIAISTILLACSNLSNQDSHMITIAYVKDELPGKDFHQNLLEEIADTISFNENKQVVLIEKIFPNEIALSDALNRDSTITIALLPDRILSVHEQALKVPTRASGLIEDMGNYAEHGSKLFVDRLKLVYPSVELSDDSEEPRHTLLHKIIPYSFNHYGFLFPSSIPAKDYRTFHQVIADVSLENIRHDGSIGGLTYLYNRYRFQDSIHSAFDQYLAQSITLKQWQSLLNSYVNVEDQVIKDWILLEALNQPNLIEDLQLAPNEVALMKGHEAARYFLHNQTTPQFRFEYPRDGALFYFDAIAFLNREPTTIDYQFVDALFDPDIALSGLQQTYKWVGLGSNEWLNAIQTLITPSANQFYQVDLSYLFSEFTMNNRVINFNAESIWYGMISNENVYSQASIVYSQVNQDLQSKYLLKSLGWQVLLRDPWIYFIGVLPIVIGIGLYFIKFKKSHGLKLTTKKVKHR